MKLKIRQTTGLTLNGNNLSGNTYPVKDYIRTYLGGKWDSLNKVWIVDVEKVNKLLSMSGGYLSVDDTQTLAASKPARSGWCSQCHSYCYGDCGAN